MGLSLATGGAAGAAVGAAGGGAFLQAVGGALAGGLLATAGEGALEAGDAYNEALKRGMTQQEANAVYDKMMNFAAWLEDEKEGPARFKETIDFLLAHLQEGDVAKPPEPVACSRGMMRAPQARNNNEEGG